MTLKEAAAQTFSFLERRFNEFLSVIGLVATLYFGILYVPSYVEEMSLSRRRLVQEELVREIGRQYYAGQPVAVADVYNAVHAKRVFYALDVPPSPREILLLVQNDFERNEYVPLEQRARIRAAVRETLKELPVPPKKKAWLSEISLWGLLSGTVALLASLLGVISVRYQFKREAELDAELEEVNATIDEAHQVEEIVQAPSSSVMRRYVDYKELVEESLRAAGFHVEERADSALVAPRLSARKGDLNFYVEPKAYMSKVGVASIRGFLSSARHMAGRSVLVTTSTLTVRAREALERHRALHGRESVSVIHAVTKSEVVEGFLRLVPPASGEKS
jgi:hypothetical protein